MSSTYSTGSHRARDSIINVNITDFILTPLSCASVVSEIIKNLLYQRSQIPYTYSWLKTVINKKRANEKDKQNLTVSHHYNVVRTAYETVENIVSDMTCHFLHHDGSIKEVVVLVGPTPLCPKEVYTVKISSLALDHVDSNHANENNKKQAKILRHIFLSEDWMNLIEKPLSCTNTFIFLKKCQLQNETNVFNDTVFILSKPLILPPKVKNTVINLHYSGPEQYLCCINLEVFQDSCDGQNVRKVDINEKSEIDEEIWLQSTLSVRGFKDCFVNKISASDLW